MFWPHLPIADLEILFSANFSGNEHYYASRDNFSHQHLRVYNACSRKLEKDVPKKVHIPPTFLQLRYIAYTFLRGISSNIVFFRLSMLFDGNC